MYNFQYVADTRHVLFFMHAKLRADKFISTDTEMIAFW